MQFRSLGDAENLDDDYRFILNLDQSLDQRTYNIPITFEEVPVVWVEGNGKGNSFDYDIILQGNNDKTKSIKS
jgi:hypothetical protein